MAKPPRWDRHQLALAAGVAAFALVLLLPRPDGLGVAGQRVAAVAVLMAVWWIGEAIPLAATALVPLVAYPVLHILPSPAVAREYGNHLVFLFLGGFMIALALERWGLHRRTALAMLARLGGSPRRLILGFMVAVAVLSMWISNTATALMILPIGMAVARRLAQHARLEGHSSEQATREALESFGCALMLGIAYAASAGGIATLIGTPPNIVLAGAFGQLFPEAGEITFGRWMIVGLPVSLTMLTVAYFVVVRWGARTPLHRFEFDDAGTEVISDERARLGPWAPGERRVLVVFGAAVILWITRSGLRIGAWSLPGWADLFPEPQYLHDATVAMAAGLALMAGRGRRRDEEESIPLLDWATVQRRTPWSILLLFGGGFALAAGFESSGLAAWIGGHLGRLQGAPVGLVVLAVCLVTTFLTEVTSNTATSTMLMPILGAAAVSLDVAPLVLMVPAALSASCAFMLPVATPPNAIVFGTEWVTVPRMARTGILLNLAGVLVVGALTWWLVPVAFGG